MENLPNVWWVTGFIYLDCWVKARRLNRLILKIFESFFPFQTGIGFVIGKLDPPGFAFQDVLFLER